MKIKFNNFKGDAMLFYMNDDRFKFPNIDQYDEILFITEAKTEIYVPFQGGVGSKQECLYFSFGTEEYTEFTFDIEFRIGEDFLLLLFDTCLVKKFVEPTDESKAMLKYLRNMTYQQRQLALAYLRNEIRETEEDKEEEVKLGEQNDSHEGFQRQFEDIFLTRVTNNKKLASLYSKEKILKLSQQVNKMDFIQIYKIVETYQKDKDRDV